MVFEDPILNVPPAHGAVFHLQSAPHTNVPTNKTYVKTRLTVNKAIFITNLETTHCHTTSIGIGELNNSYRPFFANFVRLYLNFRLTCGYKVPASYQQHSQNIFYKDHWIHSLGE